MLARITLAFLLAFSPVPAFALAVGSPGMGPAGAKGEKGETGALGPAGPKGDTGPAGSSAPIYGASGLQAGAKIWRGTATTLSDGSWSASIASAGCSSTPTVSADPLSSGTALNLSATAVVTTRTTSTVSGFVNLPLAIAIGGLAVGRAGAGLTVDLIALCQ